MARSRMVVALATALITASTAPAASAATSATGSQSVTADVADTLEATFPGAYAWGDLVAGAAANTSAEQAITVKSNATWGVRVATDQAAGKLREWTGAAYVGAGKILTNALTWRLSTLGGVAQGGAYTAFSSTPALVTGSQAATDDTGVAVGLTYQQAVSYADTNAGANDYRVLVSFDVSQGY